MGSITVASIITKVREQLFDKKVPYRFSDTVLLDDLNSGQRQIVILKPNAWVVNVARQLASGIKQTLQDGDVAFIDMVRNMGNNGNIPGAPINSIMTRQAMDTLLPSWGTDTPNTTVQFCMFDKKDPKHFYVYPPQPNTGMGYVEVVLSTTPPDAANPGTITLDDIYEMPLVNFICHRRLLKEDPAKSSMFYSLFAQAVTGKMVGEQLMAPSKGQQAAPQQAQP